MSRLIGKYVRNGQLRRIEYRRRRFPEKYTRGDMELLAKTDELRRLIERQLYTFFPWNSSLPAPGYTFLSEIGVGLFTFGQCSVRGSGPSAARCDGARSLI